MKSLEVGEKLLDNFNLLVSASRGNERDANIELLYLLRRLGDHNARAALSSVSGLTVAKTSLDPVRVTRHFRSLLLEKPWEFRYILKVKPVGRVVQADPSLIGRAVSEESSLIEEGETFRISVQKRHSKLVSKELIEAVAKQIPRKVDLHEPSRIVLIEILGEVAGVSVIRPDAVFGVEREKRLAKSQARVKRNVR